MGFDFEAISKEYHDQIFQIDAELKLASIKVLFLTMSRTCQQEFLKNEATTVSFTQDWFESKFKYDPEKKTTWFFGLQYLECQHALSNHGSLFEQDMFLMGLKCLNADNLDMLKISFEPIWHL